VRCYIDTDIFLKLVAFNLFERILQALDIPLDNVYFGPETLSKCSHGEKTKQVFRVEIWKRASKYVKKCKQIVDAVDHDELAELVKVPAIDSGEAILFAATKGQQDFLLLTGDKRALCALKNHFFDQEVYQRHVGRIICLETALLLLVKKDGFDAIRNDLKKEQHCDTAIRTALTAEDKQPGSFVASLTELAQKLQQETEGLLKELS